MEAVNAELLHDNAGSLAARVDEIAHALPFQPDSERGKGLLNRMTGLFHAETLLDGFQLIRWHGGIEQRRVFTAQIDRRPLSEFGNIGVTFMDATLRFDKTGRRDGLVSGDLLVGHHRAGAGKNDRRRFRRYKGIAALLAAGEACRHIRAQAGAAGEQWQIGAGFGQHRQLAVIHTVQHRIAVAVTAQFGEAFTHPRRPPGDIRIGNQPRLATTLRVHQADEAGIGHRRNRVIAHPRLIQKHIADK